MWYRNQVIAKFIWPWQAPNDNIVKKGRELRKLNPNMTAGQLAGYYASANLGNVYHQNLEDVTQNSLSNKNFDSIKSLLNFINSTQNLKKDVPNALNTLSQRGFKIQGIPLNQHPEALQLFLKNHNETYLNSQILTKNFNDEQHALLAFANYAKINNISIKDSVIKAEKEGYKIRSMPISQNPTFSNYFTQT